jgi:5-methylcytosine-specific restriction endonuclease McrA
MNDSFYNSRAWRRVSRVFMQSKHYICERCGGAGEVAHHKVYLNRGNVGNVHITLSMDNLECLCKACHNAEHGSAASATAVGIAFDADGNVIES